MAGTWKVIMADQRNTMSNGSMTRALLKGALRQGVALTLCAVMLPFTEINLLAQDGPLPQQSQYPVQDPGGDPNGQAPSPGYDQQGPPPQDGQAAYIPQSPQQLEQLVAPIALYPDSLVAQTLAAATYPQQVQEAESWMQQYGNQPPEQLAQSVNAMPWDPSVKALTQFPTVLDMLARGQQWTIALGNAYYNQPADVMGAVQSMRYRAQQAGQLRSTQQQVIVNDGPDIVIQPVNPDVVYVPYYNPWVVYGEPIPVFVGFYRPPPPPGLILGVGIGIGFGVGIGIAAFGHFGWGYHAWAPNWRSNTIIVNHNTFISRSTTVYNRGHFGAYNQGFNHGGPAAFSHASFNRSAPLYNGHPMNAANRPAAGNFNRPGGAGAYNRPGGAAGAYNRPGGAMNQARPAGNAYSRPGGTAGAYSRPSGTAGGYSRPSGTYGGARPAAQARPQQSAHPAAQARPSAPKAESRGGGGGGEHHGGGGEHKR
jgi:hypothetical protein